jgi:hypothetical protein
MWAIGGVGATRGNALAARVRRGERANDRSACLRHDPQQMTYAGGGVHCPAAGCASVREGSAHTRLADRGWCFAWLTESLTIRQDGLCWSSRLFHKYGRHVGMHNPSTDRHAARPAGATRRPLATHLTSRGRRQLCPTTRKSRPPGFMKQPPSNSQLSIALGEAPAMRGIHQSRTRRAQSPFAWRSESLEDAAPLSAPSFRHGSTDGRDRDARFLARDL